MLSGLPVIGPGVTQYRGDAGVLVQLLVDDGVGNMLDLSGHTLESQWRPSEDSKTFVDLDLSASSLAVGVIVVKVAAADASKITGPGVFDVQCTFASPVAPYSAGDPATFYKESTNFEKDVTR